MSRLFSHCRDRPVSTGLLLFSASVCLLIVVDTAFCFLSSFTRCKTPIGQVWLHVAENKISLFYTDEGRETELTFHASGPNDGNAPESFFDSGNTHIQFFGLAEYVTGLYADSSKKGFAIRGFAISVSYWFVFLFFALVAVMIMRRLKKPTRKSPQTH
jgi:hypothetical protein